MPSQIELFRIYMNIASISLLKYPNTWPSGIKQLEPEQTATNLTRFPRPLSMEMKWEGVLCPVTYSLRSMYCHWWLIQKCQDAVHDVRPAACMPFKTWGFIDPDTANNEKSKFFLLFLFFFYPKPHKSGVYF